jgi:major intracellular serine protease
MAENDIKPSARLLHFHKQAEVAKAEAHREVVPPGVSLTGAPLLWEQSIKGRGILVGVIDTGIDRTHPDLKDQVVIARNYVNDKTDPTEWNMHGTHVAGTIAANGFLKGVAPEARLADYRVLGVDGSGGVDGITKAIRQAVVDGCHILNLSLGSPSDYPPMHEAIKYAVAKNVLVVAAVGNSGDADILTDELDFPGAYNEVVGTASVAYHDGKLTASKWGDTNKEVDVCSVGEDVLSCAPGGKYIKISGTSMASPHVSGFAALVLCKAMMRTGSPFFPEQALYNMVKTLTVDTGVPGIDNATGAGFVTFYPKFPDVEVVHKQPSAETLGKLFAKRNKTSKQFF